MAIEQYPVWQNRLFKIFDCWEVMEGTLYDLYWEHYGIPDEERSEILQAYEDWQTKT